MFWSKEKPAEPGWYWRKDPVAMGSNVFLVYVREYAGKLCVQNWEIPNNCEWAGPLKKPKVSSGQEVSLQERIQALFDLFAEDVDVLIGIAFNEKVVPFCKARGWEFKAGMGSWWLGPVSGELYHESDYEEDAELHELVDFLRGEVPGLSSNDVGSLMPDYKKGEEDGGNK